MSSFHAIDLARLCGLEARHWPRQIHILRLGAERDDLPISLLSVMRQSLDPVTIFGQPRIESIVWLRHRTGLAGFPAGAAQLHPRALQSARRQIVLRFRFAFRPFHRVSAGNVRADDARRPAVGVADHCVIRIGLERAVTRLAVCKIGNDRAALDSHHLCPLFGKRLLSLGNEVIQHLVHGSVCLAARTGQQPVGCQFMRQRCQADGRFRTRAADGFARGAKRISPTLLPAPPGWASSPFGLMRIRPVGGMSPPPSRSALTTLSTVSLSKFGK
jgi:hypothetical protein